MEAKAIGEAAGKKNRYGKSRGLERRRVEDISGKAFRSGGGRTERMPVMAQTVLLRSELSPGSRVRPGYRVNGLNVAYAEPVLSGDRHAANVIEELLAGLR